MSFCDSVVLLNDDAVLETQLGFTDLVNPHRFP